MKIKTNNYLLGCFLVAASISSNAQITPSEDILGREADSVRTITTAVPFMIIGPDARTGAMGEAGVAISSDANAVHWNPGKLPFAENEVGLGLTVTPWLAKLGINDMYLSYLTGYYKLAKERVIYGSLTYFNLGTINFTDQQGSSLGDGNPREFNLTTGYAMKFSKTLGVGMSLKYIYSQLANGSGNQGIKPGQTAAADLSTYYNKDLIVNGRNANIAAGLAISNIGAKVTYSNSGEQKDFIPTNMRLGSAFKYDIDPYQSITFTVDANKLLVPSPPIYAYDADNKPIFNDDGTRAYIYGKDPERSVAGGMFGSFSDAPGYFAKDENGEILLDENGGQIIQKGSVIKEEFTEVVWNFGVEYWYDNLLAFRGGYFHEHRLKGARQFITVGFGLRYQMLGIDAAYIIPFTPQHPLAETVRVGLSLNMSEIGRKEEESILE